MSLITIFLIMFFHEVDPYVIGGRLDPWIIAKGPLIYNWEKSQAYIFSNPKFPKMEEKNRL